MIESAIAALSPPYQGIAKGVLPQLYEHMEKAPLFEPGVQRENKGDKGPGDALLHRLPFFYNVNHLFFYEKVRRRRHGLVWCGCQHRRVRRRCLRKYVTKAKVVADVRGTPSPLSWLPPLRVRLGLVGNLGSVCPSRASR